MSKNRPWKNFDSDGFKVRSYKDYQQYLVHQKHKLRKLTARKSPWFVKYQTKYKKALKNRIRAAGFVRPGVNVLCLAARLGTEVHSFIGLGCFAVGIDINPGNGNNFVLYGDFHNLQFASGSADVVFTNSLDHVRNITRVIAEAKRVLKPKGLLIIEAMQGSDEEGSTGSYECFYWRKISDLIKFITRTGFKLVGSSKFDYPWAGEHMTFRKTNA